MKLYRNHNLLKKDVNFKITNSRNYLDFHSNHPRHTKRALPYNLALRISKLVDDDDILIRHLNELKAILLNKNYPEMLINDAIDKGFNNRFRKNSNIEKNTNKIYFSTEYTNSSVNLMTNSTANIFTAIKNQFEHFPRIQISYRQPKNNFTQLKFPHLGLSKRCNRPRCALCPMLIQGVATTVRSNLKINVHGMCSCTSKNIIYSIICSKCCDFYIGETELKLSVRISLHRSQINNFDYRFLKVSHHINDCGNNNFLVFPLHKLKENTSSFCRKKLEKYYINVLKPGLNTETDIL